MMHAKVTFDLNGKQIKAGYVDPNAVTIPGTDYILDPYTTISTLADAVGLKTYDTALPQSFWDDYFARHGEAPRGVWSYDANRVMGEFISLRDLLIKLGEMIKAQIDDTNARVEYDIARGTFRPSMPL